MEKRTEEEGRQRPVTVMYCNNCGGKGHLFRSCKDPVLSCGLLLIDAPSLPVRDTASVRVLMIRRKDSMSFAEFMRGKYDPADKEYLGTLYRNMTIKEQSSLACDPFDTLWKQLWGDDRSCSDYPASRDKFHQLDRITLMADNLSCYTEPEWGFPKGRRMRGESDIDCAMREFQEETNIPRDAYTILKNVRVEETFMGLNGIKYRHLYFGALLTRPELVNLSAKLTPMQRREISGIAWKTFAEVRSLIRPHHSERQTMMTQFENVIHDAEDLESHK